MIPVYTFSEDAVLSLRKEGNTSKRKTSFLSKRIKTGTLELTLEVCCKLQEVPVT